MEKVVGVTVTVIVVAGAARYVLQKGLAALQLLRRERRHVSGVQAGRWEEEGLGLPWVGMGRRRRRRESERRVRRRGGGVRGVRVEGGMAGGWAGWESGGTHTVMVLTR